MNFFDFICPKIIFDQTSFSDIIYFMTKIFLPKILSNFSLTKIFLPNFFPQNPLPKYFTKRVLIDWQNCCDKCNYLQQSTVYFFKHLFNPIRGGWVGDLHHPLYFVLTLKRRMHVHTWNLFTFRIYIYNIFWQNFMVGWKSEFSGQNP